MPSVKWARGQAKLDNYTVGPPHDPYSRDVVTIVIDGLTYKLMSCGLAGESMMLPEGGEIQLVEPRHHFDDDARKRCRDDYEAQVRQRTGFGTDFWFYDLWERVENARWRRDPEAYELHQQAERYMRACI